MNVWIHKRADQTVCNASPASITPSSSRPESSLHSRDDSKEIGNIPIPIPTEVAESSPTIGIQSRGALAHDEADLRYFGFEFGLRLFRLLSQLFHFMFASKGHRVLNVC